MILTSTYKGIITGICMIAISMCIYFFKGNFQNPMQYLTYAVYVAGIIWTLKSFSYHTKGNKTFKNLFSEGFKCFIVVTLLMVAFTWVFSKMTPSFKEEVAVNARVELTKSGSYTPDEINKMVSQTKENFTIILISTAIFGYLLIGSLVTVLGSLFFRKQQVTANGQTTGI